MDVYVLYSMEAENSHRISLSHSQFLSPFWEY